MLRPWVRMASRLLEEHWFSPTTLMSIRPRGRSSRWIELQGWGRTARWKNIVIACILGRCWTKPVPSGNAAARGSSIATRSLATFELPENTGRSDRMPRAGGQLLPVDPASQGHDAKPPRFQDEAHCTSLAPWGTQIHHQARALGVPISRHHARVPLPPRRRSGQQGIALPPAGCSREMPPDRGVAVSVIRGMARNAFH